MALRPDGTLDYISLCSGGGGLDLGVELAIPAARAVVLVEREAPAVATLVAAMEAGFLAPAPVWSDVRSLDGRRFRGAVDGVVGGIPCQPHSVAGKRLGRADPRDLWGAARRIVVQSGAWFVLVENVPGMLTSGGAERVWRDLRRLGFTCEIGLFSAAEVGASHERQRLFILGVADARRLGDQRRGERGNILRAPRQAQDGRPERQRMRCPSGASLDGVADADGAVADAAGEGRGQQGLGCEAVGQRRAPRRLQSGRPGGRLGDADGQGQSQSGGGLAEGGGWAGDAGRGALSPPGPADADGWRRVLAAAPGLAPAVEPWVRRMADGLAGRLDLAGARERDGFRVDQLRLLGNGVHPLAAAHAIRTLAARLALAGSAAAAQLVSMMEGGS